MTKKNSTVDPRLAAVDLHNRADFNYGSILPLDIWLAILDAPISRNLPIKKQIEMLDEKLKVCDKAAPYIHPKLQAIDARIQGDVTLTIITGVPDRAGFDPGAEVLPADESAVRKFPTVSQLKQKKRQLKANAKELARINRIKGKKVTPDEQAATDAALDRSMATVTFD